MNNYIAENMGEDIADELAERLDAQGDPDAFNEVDDIIEQLDNNPEFQEYMEGTYNDLGGMIRQYADALESLRDCGDNVSDGVSLAIGLLYRLDDLVDFDSFTE